MSTATVANRIEHLYEFLSICLKKTIKKCSLKPLTKPGENYGSVIEALTVILGQESLNGSAETLELVVKTPVRDEYLKSIFLPAISSVKENAFYSKIIPAMKQMQSDANVPEPEQIDCFIEYIGSRLSLDEKTDANRADQNALLVLRNIKCLGFENGDRFEGFGKDTAMKILENLAAFHALPIAIRILKPKQFDGIFRPHCIPLDMCYIDPEVLPKAVRSDLTFVHGIDPVLSSKVDSQIDKCFEFGQLNENGPDTPYSTVVHRDLWTNNFMIRRDTNGNIRNLKIYDFQLYFYHSFALDLVFFLFTSIKVEDLNEHFKSFIRFYHQAFVKTLHDVNCPLEDYTFELMWNEVKSKAGMELLHILFMNSVSMKRNEDVLDSFRRVDPSPELIERIRNVLRSFESYEFL